MMRIRPDQMRALERAVALDIYRLLIAELRQEHPDRDELPNFVEEVILFASEFGFAGLDEVTRLARLMAIDADRLAGHPLSPCIPQVLMDTNRTGSERLDFIDNHLLP
ncbi:MAG TPA: hypothetical protein ENK57_21820, partial [Polyangiaceae bacterium]|nr:hypothetical protein [Polyangiaceae bacterium]